MLTSTLQQSDLVIHIHISIFQILFSCRLWQHWVEFSVLLSELCSIIFVPLYAFFFWLPSNFSLLLLLKNVWFFFFCYYHTGVFLCYCCIYFVSHFLTFIIFIFLGGKFSAITSLISLLLLYLSSYAGISIMYNLGLLFNSNAPGCFLLLFFFLNYFPPYA